MFSVLLGLLLGGLSLVLWYFRLETAGGIYRFAVCIVFGVLGSVLLFMMLFTNHDVTWYNENILFANPLLLVPTVLSLFRKEKAVRFVRICFRILLGLIVILAVLKLLMPGFFFQQNWPAIITLVMFYLPNSLKPRAS